MICQKCGVEKEEMKTKNTCVDCSKAYNALYTYKRKSNKNWMEIAEQAQIELWERQPAETDVEWSIWCSYRDFYPQKRPTYREVAENLATSVDFARDTGARWDFPVRMQAWARYVDNLTMKQRRDEVINMNKKHIEMAVAINEKIEKAIANIDPDEISPAQLSSLMKLATDLERKARLDQQVVEQQSNDAANVSAGIAKAEAPKKKEELQEVVDILMKAGALGPLSAVGVRQVTTTTTEVIGKGESDEDV